MKKVTRIIGAVCMMGLLTFVSTSCKKNQENGEATISIVVPGFVEDGERAYIDENYQFVWHENDYIRVYNLADEANADESSSAVYTKVGNATGTTARFRGPSLGIVKSEKYRYFYPVDMVKDNGNPDSINLRLWNANRQVFWVKDHQQFENYETSTHHASLVDGKAMPMAVKVDKLTDEATLHHMFGSAAFLIRSSNAAAGTMVVDSIKLVDKFHNLTGDVSLKLHKVVPEDLQTVSDEYFTNYKNFTQDYVDDVIAPALSNLGWMPTKTGKEIMLNCICSTNDSGVELGTSNTEFSFMLRPLALSEGFDLTVYLHYKQTPTETIEVHLDETDFYRNDSQTLNYLWATQVGYYKRYIMTYTLDYVMAQQN
jgi:hypothetical protein